jgi:hypothetical protein
MSFQNISTSVFHKEGGEMKSERKSQFTSRTEEEFCVLGYHAK